MSRISKTNDPRNHTNKREMSFVSFSVISWIASWLHYKSGAVLITISVGLFLSPTATAHPATGIVVDRSGNVYFSDLETIWKLDPSGKRTVFRPGVSDRHVHELAIDEEGNIYGADVSYDPAKKTWPSSVWKMTPNGKVTYVLEPTDFPPRGMSLWHDRAGNMYWVDQNNHTKSQTLLLRRTPEGDVKTLAGSSYGYADGNGTAARFGSIGGMFVAADGSIYLTDGTSVRKVLMNGSVSTVAKGLDFKAPDDDPRLFASYGGLAGVTVDADGNVYVADAGKRRLLKVDRQGLVSVIMRSEPPFFPNGVAAAAGNLYVLEFGLTLPNIASGPRIRKITPGGKSTILAVVGAENGGDAGSALAMSAGVATERAIGSLTDDGPFKYVIVLSVLLVASLIALVWQRRRRQRRT